MKKHTDPQRCPSWTPEFGCTCDLLASLKRKVIENPTGLEPPNVAALLDRLGYAVIRNKIGPQYFVNIWEDLFELRRCADAIQTVLEALKSSGRKEADYEWSVEELRKARRRGAKGDKSSSRR